MKTPAWYYNENGHRWRKLKAGEARDPRAVRGCTWCGCTSRLSARTYKSRVRYTLFVCLGRQSMLFPGKGTTVGGWSQPRFWKSFS
jgi:hypothetical protein